MTPGDKLGPYEILSAVGAGGMGEVFKARDTRLDRTVSIKFSTARFTERFDRAARALAALNHPHICTPHDLGPDYPGMEYGGKPLAGPAAVEEVLRSDLKPANILVTKTGVKLLDFGLAKLGRGRDSARADATVTQALTQENAIVGTLPYMAPEQLQGKEADPRSGIFSFRCALCEILTGKRAFEGANTASAITAGCTARIPKRK